STSARSAACSCLSGSASAPDAGAGTRSPSSGPGLQRPADAAARGPRGGVRRGAAGRGRRGRPRWRGGRPHPAGASPPPPAAPGERLSTGIGELDRVLGGGLVPGSLVLLGGSPGIGKSTLTNMVLGHLQGAGRRTLYVSGEESAAQVKLRAERLGAACGSG